MQQYITFIENHWALVLLLAVVLILIFFREYQQKKGVPRISSQEAVLLINRDHAAVLDLRDTMAYKNGHITAALNFPLTDVEANLEKLAKYKDTPLILVHNNESMAMSLAPKLSKHGFSRLYVLSSGLQSWKNAGFPLVKS